MSTLQSGDYLSINFADSSKKEVRNCDSKRCLPFAISSVHHSSISKKKLLTKGKDVKAVYDVALNIENVDHKFEPGDTIGILPRNDENEITQILARLNLTSVARKPYMLSILKETTKKKPAIPAHIPTNGTLHDLFINRLDIRSIPKKLFLRSLARFTTQQEEIDQLHRLCTPKGSQEYNEFIIKNRTLLSLLTTFPSCQPPIEILLENLPPLQPRAYSISSSSELHITFAVINTDYGSQGVCSGWLESIIKKLDGNDLKIPFYFRQINNFRLPVDPSVPIIMIGPGTGVAPFIGFLQHRELEIKENNVKFGTSWLLYGCRYSDRDFLYKSEIEQFLENGTLTKLFACFSREGSTIKYVQDEIRNNAKDFVDQIVRQNAVIYVCGDAKNMARDVRKMFVSCLVDVEGLSTVDAEQYMKSLEQTNKYIQDIWM